MHHCLQLFFIYKTVSQISFNLFFSGDKDFYQSSLGNEVEVRGHNERFPKYLGWKLKFQKTETRFSRWKSTDNKDINIFLSLENPCKEKTWKCIFNTNSELLQNRTEKQIIPSKTTVIHCLFWLNNWCFSIVVRVYYIFHFSKSQRKFCLSLHYNGSNSFFIYY